MIEIIKEILAREKTAYLATGKYTILSEVVWRLADLLARTPEEFTDLTGKKLGMQPRHGIRPDGGTPYTDDRNAIQEGDRDK